MKRNILTVPIQKIESGGASMRAQDLVAVEEPLQIRLGDSDVAITMRTPGQDRELALGFLFTEGLVANPDQIADIRVDEAGAVIVSLIEGLAPDIDARRFYVTSSCGICGKASIDALTASGCAMLPAGQPKLWADLVPHFPAKLREAQAIFEHTGGLHAAGLFNSAGELLYLREDVGRHNAVDKLIGTAFLERRLPLHDNLLMLSGRISFELVQKAVTAGIPIVIAVGAPSSLAIETALRFGMTLIGFVRGERFNVYAGGDRLIDCTGR
jgi:FdhD protein